MSENMKQFDDDAGPRVSARFEADLKALFEPPVQVSPDAERAILDRAGEHFAGLGAGGERRRLIHWRHLWRLAAAAAVVIFAFSLELTKETQSPVGISVQTQFQAADIDRNGRVDILDAFNLAWHIESAPASEDSYDLNGDGLVNRGDVDFVASAAVRLDKGVL